MIKVLMFLCLAVAASYGDTTAKPVYCGNIPNKILTCMNTPNFFSPPAKCKSSGEDNQCEVMTCTFREFQWLLKDGSVDKPKVTTRFNELAKEHPEWKSVIDAVIQNCVNVQLPAQGIHINCPAYDILHCAVKQFIKRAPESQWSKSQECVYPRQYATSCPVCPNDCFATLVPYGSCNACYNT